MAHFSASVVSYITECTDLCSEHAERVINFYWCFDFIVALVHTSQA